MRSTKAIAAACAAVGSIVLVAGCSSSSSSSGSAPAAGPTSSGSSVNAATATSAAALAVAEGGNGIVSNRTFLGATTRVAVLLSGDTEVQVDVPSTVAAAMVPGTAVQVGLPPVPVLVADRGQ